MPMFPGRAPAARPVRAAALALAALTLVGAGTPAWTAGTSGTPADRRERGWGAASVAETLRRSDAGLLRAADRNGLHALPATSEVAFHPATGRVRLLAGTRREPLATAADLRLKARSLGLAAGGQARSRVAPDIAARAFLDGTARLFGVQRVASLRTQRVSRTPDGRATVRFAQRHRGIPVIGGELIVHLDRSGDV